MSDAGRANPAEILGNAMNEDHVAANRASWNERVGLHLRDATGIYPLGPELDFTAPHDRDRFVS